MQYSFSVDDYGTMIIWADNMTVSEISDCGNMTDKERENLMFEVLQELDYEV